MWLPISALTKEHGQVPAMRTDDKIFIIEYESEGRVSIPLLETEGPADHFEGFYPVPEFELEEE